MDNKVVSFQRDSASATLTTHYTGWSSLSNVFSNDPGKGHASALMRDICAYADKHNLRIVLIARRFKYADGRGLDDYQLVQFYQKFGFEVQETTRENGTSMLRIPNQIQIDKILV